MIIRSRAPVRISFGGGGTDVPPYCDECGGCVVSATINKFAYGTLRLRDDKNIYIHSADYLKKIEYDHPRELAINGELDLIKAVIRRMNETNSGLDIFIRSDIQPKSGLGSSGAAFVTMIGLFNHLRREKKLTDYEMAELAIHLERDEIGNLGGKQDQYSSVFGGINFIEFGGTWTRVNPLRMKKDHVLELEKNLILAYVGERLSSGDIIAEQTKAFEKKEQSVVDALDESKALAMEIRYALMRGDLNYFGDLLHKGWEAKKKFSSLITNPKIDAIYEVARKNGAIGGKIAGAGGGGYMFFYCEPNKEHIVMQKLNELGVIPVSFTFDWRGLQTWEVNPQWKI